MKQKFSTYFLARFLLLFATVVMAFPAVAGGVASIESGKTYYIKCGGSVNGAQNAPYLYDKGGVVSSSALDLTADLQKWLVTAVDGKDGFFTVQNVSTSNYLVPVTAESQEATTTSTVTEVYLKAQVKNNVTWFAILKDASSVYSYNKHPNTIAGWETSTDNADGSDWAFILTPESVEGEDVPKAGDDFYTVHSLLGSTVWKIGESDGKVSLMDNGNTADYSQYWKLVDVGNGKTAFLNVVTGHYIQHNDTNDTGYCTGSDAYGFTISINTNYTSEWRYDVKDTDSYGFNSTDKGQLYSWSFSNGSSNINSLWWFKKASLTEDQQSELQKQQLTAQRDDLLHTQLKKGVVRIQTAYKSNYGTYPGGYITDLWEEGSTGTTCHMRAEKASTDADYYRQVWVIQKSAGNAYTVRNLYTGRYLNFRNTSESAVNLYIHYNPNNTDLTDYKVSISTKSDFSGENCIHYQKVYDLVVGWLEHEDSNVNGSNWYFDTPDISADVVRERFDQIDQRISNLSDAASSATENKWVFIRNLNGNYMTESTASSKGQVTERIKGNYAQVWQLLPVTDKAGYYQLKNCLTGNYLQFTTFNGEHTTGTAEADGGYKVNDLNSVFPFASYFELHPNNLPDKAVHRSNARLLTWNSYSGGSDTEGSVWWFEDAHVTDADVALARNDRNNALTEKANAETYAAALSTYFTDAACTELAAGYRTMSDADLKAAMAADGIGSENLQNMAVKVKNNAWAKWEKTFRLQDVQPFSDPWSWNNDLKVGYVYTNLSNPTGVYLSKYGEIAYVFVGADIPDKCSMAAIMVPKTDAQGSETTLKKGLNIIECPSESAALFIRYTVPTSYADTETKIADFSKIPVHIEGGVVNGYFDLTREADGIGTDEAWKEMLADGLITKFPFCQMKGERTIFNMNSTLVKKYVPEQMAEIIGFWDWVLKVEHETAGLDAFRDRWNNYLGNYSVTYNFMFATSYGTYYVESSLESILTYDDGNGGGMKYSGGSLWGPAHEMGHIHQQLFNMIGCTEISNNVFANAVLFRNGRTTTRTNGHASIHSVAEKFAASTNWHDYDIWERTRMYFQLYLYYHVQGYKKDFFPRLFDAFRTDPIVRRHTDGSAVSAKEDYLHFALKCCEVSGDDLSEFFQAYGMFVPFEERVIDDYGNFPTYATQDEINEVVAQMHHYAKPKGNILFIEDHIRLENAIDHDGNVLTDADGNAILRKDYESNCAVGKMGDVGQYSDYVDGNYADGYSCTIGTGGQVTMSGKGAVGYKVYDSAGNLLYFSNSNSFTLPQAVLTKLDGATPVVKVAQANGTDVTLPLGNVTYEVKVYHANATSNDKVQTVYTDLTEATLPKLEGNDVAYVSGENAVEQLTSLTNYVNADTHTARCIVLADLTDFYAPSDFTANELSYTRHFYEGYNSVCLPFECQASDFGDGSQVETFTGTSEDDGTNYLHFRTSEDVLSAGVPCLVKCASDEEALTMHKTNVKVVASPQTVEVSDVLTMKGSFLNQSIGAGNYKLNASGSKFGITSAKGAVGAFRSYLAPSASATQMPLYFAVAHSEAPSTGLQQTVVSGNARMNKACYDLSGRKVGLPVQKGIYIVNGKKIIR